MLRLDPIVPEPASTEQVAPMQVRQAPLRQILGFVGHTIDELVSDPIVRNKVRAMWRVHKQVEVGLELHDLMLRLR